MGVGAVGRPGTGSGRGGARMRIDVDPGLQWDGHLLLLHHSERERSSKLAAWVRRGLENDEKVVYTEARGGAHESRLLAALRGNGVDAVAATAEGRLSVVGVPEFYPAGGQLPVVERALAEGYRGLRIAAEASTALTFLTWPAYMAIEREIDEITRTHPLSAMCQYGQAAAGDDRLIADLLHIQAFALVRQGQNTAALPLIEQGLNLARGLGDAFLTARLLSARSYAVDFEGEHEGAARDAAESLAMYRRAGDPGSVRD